MHIPSFIASLFIAGGLAVIAQPSLAQETDPPGGSPEARTRCLGMAEEIDTILRIIEMERKTAIDKAGTNPTPEQKQELDQFERDRQSFTADLTNLINYFGDASEPSDDLIDELDELEGEKMAAELGVCYDLMDQMDAVEKAKAP